MHDHECVLTSPPDTVDAVQDFLSSVWGCHTDVEEMDRMAMDLALVELVGNVIEHNPGSKVNCSISVDVTDQSIRGCVCDDGSEVDGTGLNSAMPAPEAEFGRGFPLVQALVNTFEYHRKDGVNTWSVARLR